MKLKIIGIALGGIMMGATSSFAELEIKRWNPEGLDQPIGYSQVVTINGTGKIILLGGKAGLRPDGFIVKSIRLEK